MLAELLEIVRNELRYNLSAYRQAITYSAPAWYWKQGYCSAVSPCPTMYRLQDSHCSTRNVTQRRVRVTTVVVKKKATSIIYS